MKLLYKNKDRITSEITVDYKTNRVSVINYSDFPFELAFGVCNNPTMQDFEDFLESRCFPRTRDNMKLHLKELEIDCYDPLTIVNITKGRLEGDPYSLEIICED